MLLLPNSTLAGRQLRQGHSRPLYHWQEQSTARSEPVSYGPKCRYSLSLMHRFAPCHFLILLSLDCVVINLSRLFML